MAGLYLEGLLDDPVLKRVKSDDNKPPTWHQPINTVINKLRESLKLAIDGYAKSLKGLSRRMNPPSALLIHRFDNDLSQVSGRPEGCVRSRSDYATGYSTSCPLFPKAPDQVGQILFAHPIDEISRRLALTLVHAHIEQLRAKSETKTTVWRIQLPG